MRENGVTLDHVPSSKGMIANINLSFLVVDARPNLDNDLLPCRMKRCLDAATVLYMELFLLGC